MGVGVGEGWRGREEISFGGRDWWAESKLFPALQKHMAVAVTVLSPLHLATTASARQIAGERDSLGNVGEG